MNEKVITLFPSEAADHDSTYTPHRCGTWGELLNDIAWEIDHGNHTQAAQRLREFAAEFRDLPLLEEQETHPHWSVGMGSVVGNFRVNEYGVTGR